MIGLVRGFVECKYPREVMIDAGPEQGGVGYLVRCDARTLDVIEPRTRLALFTCLVLREDSQTLYGFLTIEEREFFEWLIGLHQVGPSLALALMGEMKPDELRKALKSGQVSRLTSIHGIGKKTAERLIEAYAKH